LTPASSEISEAQETQLLPGYLVFISYSSVGTVDTLSTQWPELS